MKPTIQLGVRLDPKLKRDLDRVVKRHATTIQEEIDLALRKHVDQRMREPIAAE